MRSSFRLVAALAATVGLLAAWAPAAAPTPTPPAVATPTPPAVATPTPDPCAPEHLATVTPGILTIGADNPAYPPYFEPSDPNPVPWELGDPTNGRGFEGAVAAEVARRLGFTPETTEWIPVPFALSFAPGEKAFDFYITQVSYKPERALAVDLSDGYYYVNQAAVALGDNPLAEATSIAELAAFRWGAQVGTTSFRVITDVIRPTVDPMVFDTNDAAIEALQIGQIDGIIVDLPTAFFVTAVQVEGGVIVGQFPAPPEGEHFSLVLEKDSPITQCVNRVIASMWEDGTLEAITEEWLAEKVDAPMFTP
jgi:polar amino acid transport system substrate-binding protein